MGHHQHQQSNQQQQPKHWPDGISFLSSHAWHPKLASSPSAQHALLHALQLHAESQGAPLLLIQRHAHGPSPNVCITTISDPSHPAHGQRGLVAARRLPARSHVLDYVGVLATDALASSSSDYCLRLCPDLSVDAEAAGNEGRFVNDYRGIQRKPSCKFDLYRDKGAGGQARMGVFVLQDDIPRGQELCVSYGKGWWAARGGPAGAAQWEAAATEGQQKVEEAGGCGEREWAVDDEGG